MRTQVAPGGPQAQVVPPQAPLQQVPPLHAAPFLTQSRHWPLMHWPLQQLSWLEQAPVFLHWHLPPLQTPLQQSLLAPQALPTVAQSQLPRALQVP